MKDSEADIAIGVLNKLIAQELETASAGQRYGNKPLEECATIRYHAYTFARDKIREALADAVEERDARNPFQCQRDELVTQDMHTCDLCCRRVSSPVYAVHLAYMDQAKTASEVCADCMWRLKFQPVRTVSLDSYRLYEQWLVADGGRRMKDRTPHLCRNALGTAICASNGIGPGRSTFPRHRLQHCVVCGRWWKASAVSTHLTIWTEMPDWVIRMLWHSIWESAENHPTKERGNHE